jgi:O-antigen/teichoic acid export membrane protein
MRLALRARALSPELQAQVARNASLLTNAGSMLATAAVTSLLGAVFWWLAARSFSQQSVGVAGAAVAAMTLLGFLSTLGLGTLLLGELPRSRQGRGSMINAALAVTASTGALLGLGFALAAPLLSSNFQPLSGTGLATGFFAAGVGLTALALVLDQALIGLLRGGLQLSRNAAFALVKLLALIPIAVLVEHAGTPWIYSAWALGIAFSLVVLIRPFTRRGQRPLRPDFAVLGTMRTSALAHHAFNLALEAAGLVLPILVVGLISAKANASFYIAWMIVGHLVMVPASLGTVLYPIGAHDPARLSGGLRLTIWISFALGLVANLVLLPGAFPLLQIFGSAYAAQGTAPLHIMALAVFPLTVKALYVATHRVKRTLGSALPILWGGTVFELGAAAAGAILAGLAGVAWGWLIAVCIEGLVMLRDVRRAIRMPDRGRTAAAAVEPELGMLSGLGATPADRR